MTCFQKENIGLNGHSQI